MLYSIVSLLLLLGLEDFQMVVCTLETPPQYLINCDCCPPKGFYKHDKGEHPPHCIGAAHCYGMQLSL